MKRSRRELLALELPLGVLGAAAVVLARIFAFVGISTFIPAAPVERIGVASPFSGMTRSFLALASADLGRAFEWHPLGPLVFVACLAMPVVAAASWIRGTRFAIVTRLLHSAAFWSCAAALFGLAWIRQIVALG